MVTGPGRTKPGARTTRPASSRPARARGRRGTGGPASSGGPSGGTATPGAPASSGVPASEAARWRRRLDRARADRRITRVLLVGTALVFFAILVGPTLKAYVTQQQQISALRETVTEQQARVAELQAEQARWQDPAYVEQQARQRLKFVKEGEKAYTVLDPQDGPASAPGMAAAPRDSAWYVTVWSSLRAADAPAAAP